LGLAAAAEAFRFLIENNVSVFLLQGLSCSSTAHDARTRQKERPPAYFLVVECVHCNPTHTFSHKLHASLTAPRDCLVSVRLAQASVPSAVLVVQQSFRPRCVVTKASSIIFSGRALTAKAFLADARG